MKYYRVIYNSSQRTQDGSVGLGVRTYTEGTPHEYIDALKENGFFGYSSGNLSQPSPKALLEDGTIINNFPATYIYARLLTVTGKEIYVLSRTVTVGFDYPYYAKFTAARLDNFVVDAFIFEEKPGDAAFDIFYETPAAGSNYFVPQNRVPSPDNEEMKTLSLGQMALLPVEDKTFARQSSGLMSSLSVEMLFAYIESKREKKPLLVRCGQQNVAALIADMRNLMPKEMRENAYFYTNYQLEGVKEGFDIFVINEHYKYDYAETGQFCIFDTADGKFNSVEAESYRTEFMDLISNGKNEELHKRVKWLSNPLYISIRDKSDNTKRVLYDYSIENKFELNCISKNDEELLTTLKQYFDQGNHNQDLFNQKFIEYLQSSQVVNEGLIGGLRLSDRLKKYGFNMGNVIEASKKVVTTKLLASPDTLKTALNSVSIGSLEPYFDKALFEQHQDLLDNKALEAEWPLLYGYFLPKEKQTPKVIVGRMLRLGLQAGTINAVLGKLSVKNLEQCSLCTLEAKEDSSLAIRVWPIISEKISEILKSKAVLPDATLAKNICSYVIMPLQKTSTFDNDKDRSIFFLIKILAGEITKDNFGATLKYAQNIGTEQMASIMYEKGLPFVTEKNAGDFVAFIMEKAKPDKKKFIIRAESNTCLLSALFKYTKETRKTVEKMHKDGTLNMSDDEYNKLMTGLFGETKDEPDKKGFFRKFFPIVILVLVVGVAVSFWIKGGNDDKAGGKEGMPTDSTKVDTTSQKFANVIATDSVSLDTIPEAAGESPTEESQAEQEKYNVTITKDGKPLNGGETLYVGDKIIARVEDTVAGGGWRYDGFDGPKGNVKEITATVIEKNSTARLVIELKIETIRKRRLSLSMLFQKNKIDLKYERFLCYIFQSNELIISSY